jgi:hypothetical protein
MIKKIAKRFKRSGAKGSREVSKGRSSVRGYLRGKLPLRANEKRRSEKARSKNDQLLLAEPGY